MSEIYVLKDGKGVYTSIKDIPEKLIKELNISELSDGSLVTLARTKTYVAVGIQGKDGFVTSWSIYFNTYSVLYDAAILSGKATTILNNGKSAVLEKVGDGMRLSYSGETLELPMEYWKKIAESMNALTSKEVSNIL